MGIVTGTSQDLTWLRGYELDPLLPARTHTTVCAYSITYMHCQTYSSTPYKYKLEIIIPLIDIGLGSRGQLDLKKEVHMLITKGHCTIWVLSHRLLPYRVF